MKMLSSPHNPRRSIPGLLIAAFVATVTAAGCSTAPEDREASSTQALSSGYGNAWCTGVNSSCTTSPISVPPYWYAFGRPPTAEQKLILLGCDQPTLWTWDQYAPSYTERYTTCPAGSAGVQQWVSTYSAPWNPYTTGAWGAHFNDIACDHCIPIVPSGRDYVFYDGNQPPPTMSGGPCLCTQATCMGCPGGSWW